MGRKLNFFYLTQELILDNVQNVFLFRFPDIIGFLPP